MQLLLGCGHRRGKRMCLPGKHEWEGLVTADINPECKPDVVMDAGIASNWWIWPSRTFSEIHAYEVIEHIIEAGNPESFFDFFRSVWRVLIPDGLLFATVPNFASAAAWGDPGHKCVLTPISFAYLSQQAYKDQLGETAMTDYRNLLGNVDFAVEGTKMTDLQMLFVLRAIKPTT